LNAKKEREYIRYKLLATSRLMKIEQISALEATCAVARIDGLGFSVLNIHGCSKTFEQKKFYHK
jgi:hypothetical protein